MENIIETINVYYRYNKKIECLKGLNFNIKKGSFHAFIGENGAGKSTTIKILVGLIQNYEGDILFNNQNIRNISDEKSISFIPDKAIFPNDMNTKQFLTFCARVRRDDKIEIEKEINYWSEQLDIIEVLQKNPNKLSAGQKKKVLLIKAIIEKSELIILDEPAANLDPTSRIQLFKTLKNLSSIGKTIFISTHILEEIKNFATHATFIRKGEHIWTGEVKGDEINDIYSKHYLGSYNE